MKQKPTVTAAPPPGYIDIPEYYIPTPRDRLRNEFFGRGVIEAVQSSGDDHKVRVLFGGSVGEKMLIWSITKERTLVYAADAVLQAPRPSPKRQPATQPPRTDQPLVAEEDTAATPLAQVLTWADQYFAAHYQATDQQLYSDFVAALMERADNDAAWLRRRLQLVLEAGQGVTKRNLDIFFTNALQLALVHELVSDLKPALKKLVKHYRRTKPAASPPLLFD